MIVRTFFSLSTYPYHNVAYHYEHSKQLQMVDSSSIQHHLYFSHIQVLLIDGMHDLGVSLLDRLSMFILPKHHVLMASNS